MALKITTWNIQNFTQANASFGPKLAHLGATLIALKPHVVCLQEILDPAALTSLADALGYQAIAGTPDSRGNRVGMLVRDVSNPTVNGVGEWRLAPGVVVRDFDSNGTLVELPTMTRPALHVAFDHAGRRTHVITVHLKSKLFRFAGQFTTSDETLRARTAYAGLERRAAESVTIRELVTELLGQGGEVLVAGDLNDGPEAATTQILYGPPGSEIRDRADALRVNGAFQQSDERDSQRLFNTTKLVPAARRWTRKHNGQGELLDHVLASEGFFPRLDGVRQLPTVSIRNDVTPNLIGDNPDVAGAIPDHAPVTVGFH